MNPLASVLWSLARVFVAMALSWMVAKGWISSDQAKSASPELVSLIVLGVGWLLLAAHGEFQKYQAWRAGLRRSESVKVINTVLSKQP